MSSNTASCEDADFLNTWETLNPLLNDCNKSFEEIHPLYQRPEATENIRSRQQDVCLTISPLKALKGYRLYPKKYLLAHQWKSVFLDANPWHAGLVLVVSMRYSSFLHEKQPVKACPNESQERHPPADLCKDASFRLFCRDSDKYVKYFLDEDAHPTAEVSLKNCKEDLEIRFLCTSACSHHAKNGKLTILKLGRRLETTREVVWCNSYTVRVAANITERRANDYYRQDINKESPSSKSPGKKQKLQSNQEKFRDSSISCIKKQKVDLEGEPNDESTIDKGFAAVQNGAGEPKDESTIDQGFAAVQNGAGEPNDESTIDKGFAAVQNGTGEPNNECTIDQGFAAVQNGAGEPNDERTIDQGLEVALNGAAEPNDKSTSYSAVALNGASSSASPRLFTSSFVPQEIPSSSQFNSIGSNGGATASPQTQPLQTGLFPMTNEAGTLLSVNLKIGAECVAVLPPVQEDAPSWDETPPGHHTPSTASLQFGTESEVSMPIVGQSALEEGARIDSTSTKILVIQLRDHDANAGIISQFVTLEGGTCQTDSTSTKILVVQLKDHDANAGMISKIVTLEGGTYQVDSLSTKVLVVQLRDHDANAGMISKIVMLEGGTCQVDSLSTMIHVVRLRDDANASLINRIVMLEGGTCREIDIPNNELPPAEE